MKAFDLFNVRGRTVMITGAASGIGLSIAQAMADNGARVVLADRDVAGLERAQAELATSGAEVSTSLIDLEHPGELVAEVEAVAERLGRLDVMFANAGVSAGPGYIAAAGQIDALEEDIWERSTRVNLMGAVFTIKAAARVMKRQGGGSIVVTTSTAALSTSSLPGYAYFAAKSGLSQVLRVAANELAPHGVRVNGFAPGAFPTNMAGGRMKEADAAARFAALAPMNRIARMEEIQGVALLLASDASSYMTGANIPVDGGVAAA